MIAEEPYEAIKEALVAADVEGYIHARDLGGSAEIAINADHPVVTASTYKVAVLLELAQQGVTGELDLSQPVLVPAARRSMGPTGLSVMADDVQMSLRDLALLMMQISDNTATDVIQETVGTARVVRRLRSLGLERTNIDRDCAGLLKDLVDELGGDLEHLYSDELPKLIAESPSLNAERGNVTTRGR